MAVLIDTSILIEHERGQLELEPHLRKRLQEEFFLSIVTASELLHGVHRAQNAQVRARRSAFVEALLDRFPLLPLDLPTARVHARLWATLQTSGQVIGPHDLWLAATCLAHSLTMVTANVREFSRVPGLDVEVWHQASALP